MRIAFTCNGPGEWNGWARPLLRELYARDPALDAHVFFVPDDYATGREPEVARATFPQLAVHPPRDYLATAVGGRPAGVPDRVDRVQYLGGDLMHAARLQSRLGGVATSYKFSRARYRDRFAHVFAVDAPNRDQLLGWKTPPDRIEVVGNLAIDGALGEAAGAYPIAEPNDPREAARDGILILPGSRRLEIRDMLPLYVSVGVWLRRKSPSSRVAFAISPFVRDADLDAALRGGGVDRAYGTRARLDVERAEIVTLDGEASFPIVRGAVRAAATAGVVLTIPGTKTIELAALGVPTVVTLPFNAPEDVVINGPLQYIGRLPFLGLHVKRTAAMAIVPRFRFFSQPNMDANDEVQAEIVGTLFPARVATLVLERLADVAWRAEVSERTRALYAAHAGAAGRIAAALLAA